MKSYIVVALIGLLLGLSLLSCNHDNKTTETTLPIDIRDTATEISFDSLRNLVDVYSPEINRNEEQLFNLFQATQPVYEILIKIIKSSELVNSPNNNLTWYRVSKVLIAESGLTKDSVFNIIDEIISWYDGGNQQDLNYAAYMRQVMAHYHELDQFNDYLTLCPTQYREYELFSIIQSDIIDTYIKNMYDTNHYSSLPMDVSAGVVNYLNSITSVLKAQNALLRGEPVHFPSQSHSLNSFSDKQGLSLFPEWKRERAEFSKSTHPNIRGDYDKITSLLENSINE